jgi:hypothetical protein
LIEQYWIITITKYTNSQYKKSLGTGSWKFSTENFTFRRSIPAHKARRLCSPEHKKSKTVISDGLRFLHARHGAGYRNLLEDKQRAYLATEYQAGFLWNSATNS